MHRIDYIPIWKKTALFLNGMAVFVVLKIADIFKCAPLWIRYRLAEIIFFIVFVFSHKRRYAVRCNLEVIFRRKPRNTEILKVFLNYGYYWAEFVDIVSLWKKSTIIHHGSALIDPPKAFLGLTFHLGNFELFGPEIYNKTTRSPSVVAEHLQPSFLARYFQKKRQYHNFDTIPHHNVRQILSTIRNGKILGIVCDRMIDGKGVKTHLFGHAVELPLNIIEYALKEKIPIIVAYFIKDNNTVTLFSRKVESDDLQTTIATVSKILEEAIQQFPYQWHQLTAVFGNDCFDRH